jgi:hypothetical protein
MAQNGHYATLHRMQFNERPVVAVAN